MVLKKIFITFIFALLVVGSVILIINFFQINEISKKSNFSEANNCADKRERGYCYEGYLNDGLIRFSVSPSQDENCCIIERLNISEDRVNYNIKACAVNVGVTLNCAKYQTQKNYMEDFLIDENWVKRDKNWIGDRHE